MYNFGNRIFSRSSNKKKFFPFTFLLFQGKFSTTLKNSLSLSLSKSTSSLGISLTFPPSGARPWRRGGRRLRLLFVTFQLFHRVSFRTEWNRDPLEYTFDYFSSFEFESRSTPRVLLSFSTNDDPWSLANSLERALKRDKCGDKDLESWSTFESAFDRRRKCGTAWMKPRSTRVSNESIKPRKWWSRVIFACHICDMMYNWWTTKWDSMGWYVCDFLIIFSMEIILAIVFNNVKISGKMKIICFDYCNLILPYWYFSSIINWMYSLHVILKEMKTY